MRLAETLAILEQRVSDRDAKPVCDEYMSHARQKAFSASDPDTIRQYATLVEKKSQSCDENKLPGFNEWKHALAGIHVIEPYLRVLRMATIEESNQDQRGDQKGSSPSVPTNTLPEVKGTVYTCPNKRQYDTKSMFDFIVKAIKAVPFHNIGLSNAYWSQYGKCRVDSHCLVFDENMRLRVNSRFTTKEQWYGSEIWGKVEHVVTGKSSTAVEHFCDLCGGDIMIFGYYRMGSIFVIVPLKMFVQPLKEALQEIGMSPLCSLTKQIKRMKRDITIALFGPSVCREYGNDTNSNHVCLWHKKFPKKEEEWVTDSSSESDLSDLLSESDLSDLSSESDLSDLSSESDLSEPGKYRKIARRKTRRG